MGHTTLENYNVANTQKLISAIGVEAEPILYSREQGIKTCSLPLCVSCVRGKERADSVASATESTNSVKFYVIKYGHPSPGYTVSMNQYECRVKCRLTNTRGREDPTKTYCEGIIFNDHASSKIDVYHQVSLGVSNNIGSKELYE